MKALVFTYLVAQSKDLKKLAREVRKHLPLSIINNKDDKTTFFVNMDPAPKKQKIFTSIYTNGLFSGLHFVEVCYFDTDEETVFQAMEKIEVSMKFLGHSPDWSGTPTYLLWTKSSFPSLQKTLGENKNLEKYLEIDDNTNKEKL